jgi:hypothetical protein
MRGAEEQKIGDPSPLQMMRTVVDQVTALTKTAQVAKPIIGRIMIHDAPRQARNALSASKRTAPDQANERCAASIAPHV